jgi:adenosine deaminase
MQEYHLKFVCSSNIKSGVVKRPKEHPVRQLWESGAKITINTDDPTLCNTTNQIVKHPIKEFQFLSK